MGCIAAMMTRTSDDMRSVLVHNDEMEKHLDRDEIRSLQNHVSTLQIQNDHLHKQMGFHTISRLKLENSLTRLERYFSQLTIQVDQLRPPVVS